VAFYIGHVRRFELAVVWIANLGRAIPSFAILAGAFYVSVSLGLGVRFWPTFAAIFVLAIPPILTNTYVGVREVDADVLESARGMGMTERQIAARMQYELLMNGTEMIAAPVFSAGTRSGYFHPLATDDILAEGMIFKCDFCGYLDGYYSDIARTAVLGKASDRQRDIHAKVTEIKHRIVEYIKPGMLACDVANFGIGLYGELGLEFKWAILGHSIGLGIHESPQIYPWVEEPIETGMIMMIEVGYTDYPHDSFHVEDLILIKEYGAEYLTDAYAHDPMWEVGA
jgi:Xaa-Pro aminopeptidase